MLDNLIRQLHGQSEPLYCHACLEFTTFFSIPLDFQDNRYKLGHYLFAHPLLDLAAIAIPNGFQQNGVLTGVTFIAPPYTERYLSRIGSWFHQYSVSST